MRLDPVPIPSDASKAPILPGISLELFDLYVLLILVSPFLILIALHVNINIFYKLLAAVPGLIASIWLVWAAPIEGRKGWERLLARFYFNFMSTRRYLSGGEREREYIGVVKVGNKDRR